MEAVQQNLTSLYKRKLGTQGPNRRVEWTTAAMLFQAAGEPQKEGLI